jgi:hypothetical protein
LNIKDYRIGLTLQKAHAHGFRAVRRKRNLVLACYRKIEKTPFINTFDRSTTGLYTTGNKGLIQVVAGNERLMRV